MLYGSFCFVWLKEFNTVALRQSLRQPSCPCKTEKKKFGQFSFFIWLRYERLKNFVANRDLEALEKKRSCWELIVDIITMFEDLPYGNDGVSRSISIFEMIMINFRI